MEMKNDSDKVKLKNGVLQPFHYTVWCKIFEPNFPIDTYGKCSILFSCLNNVGCPKISILSAFENALKSISILLRQPKHLIQAIFQWVISFFKCIYTGNLYFMGCLKKFATRLQGNRMENLSH